MRSGVPDAFKAIVIDGVLQPNGMVSFRKVLTPQDAEAIRAYVVVRAHQAKNAPPGSGLGRGAPAGAPAPGTSSTPVTPPAAPHQ